MWPTHLNQPSLILPSIFSMSQTSYTMK
uniref:Uncharacterized protein n=1 Tax=Rhizophora mucronata TaxID=61149 RepID=A0A2P2N1S7_RHIMU